MSSSAARARDEDQLVVGGLLPAVHGRFTSPRSYLSPDLSSSYSVASSITSSETAQTSLANGARSSHRALWHWRQVAMVHLTNFKLVTNTALPAAASSDS